MTMVPDVYDHAVVMVMDTHCVIDGIAVPVHVCMDEQDSEDGAGSEEDSESGKEVRRCAFNVLTY